jgi:hypothetical protein
LRRQGRLHGDVTRAVAKFTIVFDLGLALAGSEFGIINWVLSRVVGRIRG